MSVELEKRKEASVFDDQRGSGFGILGRKGGLGRVSFVVSYWEGRDEEGEWRERSRSVKDPKDFE